MLTLKPFVTRTHGRPMMNPNKRMLTCHFHCAHGFATQILAYTLDSLVRVSRRDNEGHFLSNAPGHGRLDIPRREERMSRHQTASRKGAATNLHRFLANHFRYFFTLFSKFFSPFLHSTCSLSVNRQYLALDGVYHPF